MLQQTIFNLDEEDHKNSLKNSAMSRIQNDLNSPSANIRLRAIKALKSPSIVYYNNFDVPHQAEEIDFTEGKRHLPPHDIKEVMKKVVVYVEIRSGEDNHSAGIKKVISQLGAKVNDNLLRNTTHVVFKDGLQSTYNKAKKWEIPIVSILWIEACKKHIKLMDSKLYPISNQDRYENPELYGKIKRIKYMNSDTEENNNRIKIDSVKNVNTPKKIRCSVRMPKTPRDSLNEIFLEFQEKLKATADDDDDEFIPFQSKLLERIRNSPCTPKTVTESKSTEKNLNRRKSIHTINKTKQLDNNKSKISTPQLKTNNRKSCVGFAMSNPASTKTGSFTPKSKISANTNLEKKIFDFFPKQTDDLIFYNDEPLDKSEKKENMCPGTPEMYSKINTSKFMEMRNSKIGKLEVTPKNSYANKRISTPIHAKFNNNKNITDQLDTIIEDIPDSIIFNSTKKPSSRRKTIFESSMDIIDQRLHHFNELSKLNKSLADENPIEVLSNSSYKTDNWTAVEQIKSFSSLNISADVVGTPKKRKLFVPEQCIFSTPTGKEIIIDNFKHKSIGSTVKRKIVEDNCLKSKKLDGKRRRTINICTATANSLQQQSGKK